MTDAEKAELQAAVDTVNGLMRQLIAKYGENLRIRPSGVYNDHTGRSEVQLEISTGRFIVETPENNP